MLIASLLIGAVTMPSIQPSCASSTAFLINDTDAAPVPGVGTPWRKPPKGTIERIQHSKLIGPQRRRFVTFHADHLHLELRLFTVCCMTGKEPITIGRHSRRKDLPARAFAMTSGPIPAGSPIVIPSSGLSFDFVMFFLTFIPFTNHSLHRMLKKARPSHPPNPGAPRRAFSQARPQ